MKNFIIHQAIKYNKWRRGVLALTLIELVIVVAVIALLAILAAATFLGGDKCESSKTDLKKKLEKLKSAVLNNLATQVEMDNVKNAFTEFNKSCNKAAIPQDITKLIAEVNQAMTSFPPKDDSIYTNFKQIFGLP